MLAVDRLPVCHAQPCRLWVTGLQSRFARQRLHQRPCLSARNEFLQGRALLSPVVGRRRRQACGLCPVRAAMFDGLSTSLEKAWDIVRKDGKLTAENIKAPMREIRRALLEADVSLPVVRQFVARVEERALGVKVVKGVRPEQKLVSVVNEELIQLMGGEQQGLVDPPDGPQVVLMAGLQGVGKTTACGKLALALKKQKRRPLLVATDVYRPAAIDQLVSLGKRVDVPVFEMGTEANPVDIAREGLKFAEREGYDSIIVDTAGRLQINEAMMGELRAIQEAVRPSDTLLVVDAMTGQEAAGLVKAFNDAAELTGAILTKMDGDSRGGAALSVKAVSGKPIKFVGTGERMEALEPFYPDRIASRILGMGDVLSLVEMAESSIKESEAEAMMARMLKNKFDFTDFLKQYRMVSGMGGGMSSVMKMLPGMGKISDKQLAAAEKEFKKYESMIQSMTAAERAEPELLAKSASRRRRIARGSGRTEADVSALIGTFSGMRARMTELTKLMRMGGSAGLPGMPSMSQEEMLAATVAGSGPSRPAPGMVRRRKSKTKKGSRALEELSLLRAR